MVEGRGAWLEPGPEPERLWLDERSWVDVARGILPRAGEVYRALTDVLPWQQGRLFRYERWQDEPRLGASVSLDRGYPHPALLETHRLLRHRYGVDFDGAGVAWYRDGRDGQAFHRDRDLRHLDNTLIAILTLGARRPWYLRPRDHRYDHADANKGATHDLAPGSGDLIVMGGATQVGWEHSVPQVRAPVAGRISVQWRWTDGRGQPVQGASWRAPRLFSGGHGRPSATRRPR